MSDGRAGRPEPRFRTIVGTGGIGAGIIFRLDGDRDLGRNESRQAMLLDRRDYCKLHIVLHYAATLLRGAGYRTAVLPVGAVGDDESGRRLVADLRAAGMDVRHVAVLADAPTLFSVCFAYPDGSGGNITAMNSASSRVDAGAILRAEPDIAAAGERCLVAAVPEVPLDAREAALDLAKRHGAFTAASFVSEELAGDGITDILRRVDLLALNVDEAAALAATGSRLPAERIVRACIERLTPLNPAIRLSVSHGREGAYAYEDGRLEHLPVLDVDVRGTAGAGDAMLAGLLVGLTAGLPFLGHPSRSCFRLARLLAAMSVTSEDTINFDVDARSLASFAAIHGEEFPL